MIIKNNTTKLLVTLSFLLILPFVQKQWFNLYSLNINDISFYSILYYLSGAICPSLVCLNSLKNYTYYNFNKDNIHNQNIMHRDLKSHNILVKYLNNFHRDNFKLSDFGSAYNMNASTQSLKSKGDSNQGTLAWMAPELMNAEDCMYGPSVDIYSFGMIMYEFLSGAKPWREFHLSTDIVSNVSSGKRPHIPKQRRVPELYLDFMQRCWEHQMEKRPLIDVVCRKIAEIRTREVSKATQRYEEKIKANDENESISLPRTVSLISQHTNTSPDDSNCVDYQSPKQSPRMKARSSSLESALNNRRTPSAKSPRFLPLPPPTRRAPTAYLTSKFKLGSIPEKHETTMEKLDLLL